VAQYTEPTDTMERVYDLLVQSIVVENEYTDLQAQHILRLRCDHSEIEQKIWDLERSLTIARGRPNAEVILEEMQPD